MNIDLLKEELKRDEGVVRHAYQDTEGYWTIGCGRLIDKRRGGGLSASEIDMLLGNDLEKVIAELSYRLPWWASQSEKRQHVLINMAFQMGIDGLLKFRNTLALIKAGKYDDAADEMLNSKWAKQTPNRAKRLSQEMREG